MNTLKAQKKIKPLMCTAVGAANHWHELEGCAM